MQAQQGHSAACCNVPPVVISDYSPKGRYETIIGLKTYVSGRGSAETGLLYVADIFGFYSQTIQGADILAHADHPLGGYQVFVPDFFNGKPADISWYPPANDDHRQALSNFFENQGSPSKAVQRIPDLIQAIQDQYPSIKTWGIVGFCWGGKVVSLAVSQDGMPFKVCAECHPAMVDSADAKSIPIPVLILASKDEDANEVANFQKLLTVEHRVETFGDQSHGWMAARADLNDPRVKSEYARGYSMLIDFFHKHL